MPATAICIDGDVIAGQCGHRHATAHRDAVRGGALRRGHRRTDVFAGWHGAHARATDSGSGGCAATAGRRGGVCARHRLSAGAHPAPRRLPRRSRMRPWQDQQPVLERAADGGPTGHRARRGTAGHRYVGVGAVRADDRQADGAFRGARASGMLRCRRSGDWRRCAPSLSHRCRPAISRAALRRVPHRGRRLVGIVLSGGGRHQRRRYRDGRTGHLATASDPSDARPVRAVARRGRGLRRHPGRRHDPGGRSAVRHRPHRHPQRVQLARERDRAHARHCYGTAQTRRASGGGRGLLRDRAAAAAAERSGASGRGDRHLRRPPHGDGILVGGVRRGGGGDQRPGVCAQDFSRLLSGVGVGGAVSDEGVGGVSVMGMAR
eukprot:ctg_1481.g425